MKNLDKTQSAALSDLIARLRAKSESLIAAVRELNDTILTAGAAVTTALENYNAVVEEAEQFRGEIQTEQQDYWDDRSEKWQAGDAGGAYESWKDSWSNSLDPIEIALPAEIEDPEPTHADDLESLGDGP